MKRYVIDTNALLSFVTDRNTAQQAVMTGVFEQVAAAQASVLCPQNVIAEFVYVMETVYHQPKPSIRSIVTDFIATPGVTIVDKTDFDAVFSLWPETFEDFEMPSLPPAPGPQREPPSSPSTAGLCANWRLAVFRSWAVSLVNKF